MDADEKKSFSFGGQRARPRKGIERQPLMGVTFLKPPGSCLTRWPGMGINVEVECCEKSSIYVLDPCEQVQISECVDCRIVIGPCVGSAVIFDCVGCTIAFAAKQTRLRDCAKCELRGYGPTLECIVIETSRALRFGSWDICYPGLAAHFRSTKWLQRDRTNYWDKIFDFSPAEKGKTPNWSPLPGIDPAGRWCQLKITPEGYNGGSVVEVRSDVPSVEGCECPIAAQDGTVFEAPWYSSADDAAAAVAEAQAAAEAKAAAAATEQIAIEGLGNAASSSAKGSQSGLLRRLFGWLLGGRRASRASAYSAGSVVDVSAGDGPAAGRGGSKQATQVCIVS